MAFELGQIYGDYQFIDIIESSRTGVTYKARNLKENRFELLKVMPRSVHDDPERVERFFREAKVRSRLQHPNIEQFYNATVLEGQFVMTTELVEGRPLSERLELGALDIDDAAELAMQTLEALEAAHQHGIMHRDICPGNLIRTPEGNIKLSGFSFARAATDPKLTQVGAAFGEIYYMSPEQVRGVEALDPRTDLYSVGIVLYEMLTGKRPFDSASQFEVMLAHVNTPPAPPSRLNHRVTPDLDAIVLRALAKDPAHRFQTAGEFLEALDTPESIVRLPVAALPEIPVAAPAPQLTLRPSVARQTPPSQTPVPHTPMPAGHAPHLASAAPPASAYPELRFGPREFIVLGLGVALMVTSVLFLLR